MALEAPPLYDAIAVIPGSEYGMVKPPRQASAWPKFQIGPEWLDHIDAIQRRVDRSPDRRVHVRLTGQVASIPTTALPLLTVDSGIYRITYYFRVTRAGSVSSSLTFTLTWTDGTIVIPRSGAAEAGNTTSTYQFGTFIVRSDQNQPISYATTYADCGGAVAMAYLLDVIVEQLAADSV